MTFLSKIYAKVYAKNVIKCNIGFEEKRKLAKNTKNGCLDIDP
jgi:hypothetical protein